MPTSSGSDRDYEETLRGFIKSKRVWLATHTWDGALLAKKYAEYAEGMRIADEKPDQYGRILVYLGDGTPERIRKDCLRLTPPPSLSNKQQRVKAAKPKKRKEAVDPQYGEETTIWDHLETK